MPSSALQLGSGVMTGALKMGKELRRREGETVQLAALRGRHECLLVGSKKMLCVIFPQSSIQSEGQTSCL